MNQTEQRRNEEYLITDAPLRALAVFAVPMILGSLFQQVYNMVDSIIVGRFVGQNALAAIGASAALTAVFICNGQDLTIKLLDDQGDHEEGVGVFLRHDDKNGRLLAAKFLGVDLRVEAQELFQFGIQEGVQPRQRRGHDGSHALLGGVQGGSGEPFGFVVVGEHLHELLELILANTRFVRIP